MLSREIQLDPDVPDVLAPSETQVVAEYVLIDNEYARIDGVLRRHRRGKASTVVVQTHPRRTSAMNLSAWPMSHLVGADCDTFAFNNRATNSAAGTEVITIWEDLALDVAAAVAEMRRRGYQHVVLYGHSAGGPLVSYYQNVAENGSAAFSAETSLSAFAGYHRDGRELGLPPGDAIITQSSTTGTAYSFLMRLDGSVVNEELGTRDPELNPFLPANGFDVESGAAVYSDSFARSYFAAQCARMNRLVDRAREMGDACRAGRGSFLDDELIVIRGIRGELSCVDLSLASRTTQPQLISSSAVPSVVASNRRVVPDYARRNASFRDGGTVHTLKSFLSYRAITGDPTRWNPDAVTLSSCGLDLASSNTTTSLNMSGVSVPLLITAGTADTQVHLPAAELLLNSALRTSDKKLVFIDTAEHDMTLTDARVADTRDQHLAVVAGWLAERFA